MRYILLSAITFVCFSGCVTDIAGSGNEANQVASSSGSAEAQTEPAYVNTLPLERLFQSPSLSGPTPRSLAFSPDGSKVTFLKPRDNDGARLDLWAFDVATGEASMLVDSTLLEPKDVEISEQEKALRERKRIAGAKGIVSYQWGTANSILVPIGGDLYLVWIGNDLKVTLKPKADELGVSLSDISQWIREEYFGEEKQVLRRDQPLPEPTDDNGFEKLLETEVVLTSGEKIVLGDVVNLETDNTPSVDRLTNTDAFEFDAKVSPGGRYVSFIRDGALHAIDLTTGEEQQLTPDAEPENAVSYGVAEFVAQEEMSRYTGYWWSPDDKYVAYTRVDESTVDIVPRFDIAADKVTVIEQRYPKAGRPNAVVDLFVRDMETGEAVEVDWRREDWGPATDQYLARVNWSSPHAILMQIVNRDQTILRWIGTIDKDFHNRAWFTNGGWTEEHETWINLSNDFIPGRNGLITTNEVSGFRHIGYAPDSEDGERRNITSGEWVVSSLSGKNGDTVFFTGYKDTPLERHLYSVPLNGGDPIRITPLGASWDITMSPDGQSYIGASSSPGQPPQVGLYKSDGTLITWIEENALTDTEHPYYPYAAEHTVPAFGTLKAEDDQDLYYSIQLPPDFDDTKQYPVIIEVYGGPHVQRVSNSWRSLSDQYLTREGYIVFRLDNRGSDNRGRKFEDVIYRRTGGPEVRDQLVGVDYLKSLPYVDTDRIAIQGWSYGGYMTLMTLLQAEPRTFAAAVSGAPVTDWGLYDTFYTERYMDTPQDNPEGYEASSVFPYIDNLEDPLLLIHGMADDNVVFENTTRLMAELQERGKHFELMTYPGQRHGIRGEKLQIHLMRTRMEFLNRHLKPGGN